MADAGEAHVSDLSDLTRASRAASRLFRLIESLRSRYGVDLDEVMVYFAVGRLTYDRSQSMMMIRPTNIASLSDFLGIPRETLRRKLLRLEERELVQRSSAGFAVRDPAVWRRLAEVAVDDKADAE